MTPLAKRESEFLLYIAPDGAVKVSVLFRDETAWLTQRALAELFGVKVPAIAKHLKNIFESGELGRSATVSKMEIVQSEGRREVVREVELYNLDAIIAVGYRVNSYQATQFRIWAQNLAVAEPRSARREPAAAGEPIDARGLPQLMKGAPRVTRERRATSRSMRRLTGIRQRARVWSPCRTRPRGPCCGGR